MSTPNPATPRCWRKRRSRFLELLLVLLLASAQSNEDVLLLAVRVDGEIIEEAMPARSTEQGALLPVAELARLLELTAADESLYLDAKGVGERFGFECELDLHASLVVIRTREPLPFQRRRAREQETKRLEASLQQTETPLPLVGNPYKLLSQPSIDQQIRILSGAQVGGTTMQHSTLATGDLFGMEAVAYLSGNNVKPVGEARLTLGRVGPVRAFGLGDVFVSGNELFAESARGTGFFVSNFPWQQGTQFDRETIAGDLAPGWDVELYLNDALIGFERPDNGRYEFRDVPVLYGLNLFRLVFHGPQGQQRTEVRTFNIGETLAPRGRWRYRVAALSPQTQPRRALAEVAWGATSNVTFAGALGAVEQPDGTRRHYVTTGVRTAWRHLFAYADGGVEQGGGQIVRAGLQARLGRVSVALAHAQLHDYVSETFRSFAGPVTARTTLRIGGSVTARLPLTFDVSSDELAEGGRVVRFGALSSTYIRRTWISNRLDGTLLQGVKRAGLEQRTINGSLLVSRFVSNVSVRGEVGYDVKPRAMITTAGIVADTRRWRQVQVGAEVIRSFTSRVTRFIGRVGRDRGRVSVALAVEVPTRGSPLVSLELGASALRNPLTRRWRVGARPAAGDGAIAARVFLDRNANGARDEGEPPIEGAGFFVNRASRPNVTDADGVTMLEYLPVHQQNDVLLSADTVAKSDPFWAPAIPGVRLVPRPGKVQVVDFPVTVTGEITGTVYIDEKPRGAVRLQLVDEATGIVVREGKSEYDGFYDFEKVPPGKYTVRIREGQQVTGESEKHVEITPDSSSRDGVDFRLGRVRV